MDWIGSLVDWQHVIHVIVGIVSSAIVAGLGKWLGVKLDEAGRKKLDWAIEKGVAAAAQKLRGASGGEKQQLAIRTAETLAPKSFGKLSDTEKEIVTEATYARMRSSLPTSTSFVLGGDEVPHATDDLGSRPPPPKDTP